MSILTSSALVVLLSTPATQPPSAGDGSWNAADTAAVVNTIASDMLSRSWLKKFNTQQQRMPRIRFRPIRTRVNEGYNFNELLMEMVSTLRKSGKVELVPLPKKRGHAQSIDYVLLGNVGLISEKSGKAVVKLYQVSFELVDVRNGRKVWIGDKSIKKLVSGQGPRTAVTTSSPSVAEEMSRVNATDLRLLAKDFAHACAKAPWSRDFQKKQQRAPRVRIDRIYNRTRQHMRLRSFADAIGAQLAKMSSSIQVIPYAQRAEDADFLLSGTIEARREEGRRIIRFSISISSPDGAQMAWQGAKELRKPLPQQ